MFDSGFKNILLVEDNPAHAALIGRSFDSHPFEERVQVLVANNLGKAKGLIESNNISLAITDVQLPDGKGTDLLTLDIWNNNFPIVIMTSHGNEDLAVESLKRGATDYIVKSTENFLELPKLSQRWIDSWKLKVEQRIEELEMIERKAELEKSNKELRRIAYSISHDLATPLDGIIRLSSWIEEDLQNENPRVKDNIRLLNKRAKRLKGFMNGLVDYSKVSNIVDLKVLEVRPLIDSTIKELKMPKEVEIHFGDLPHKIKANRYLLCRLFKEIIENTYKHNDLHDLKVKIESVEFEDFIQFSILDNGIGIEPRHHQKVFELFQILSNRDKDESLGVGLAIAKKIVEDAEGRIWVDASECGGAAFHFTLPKYNIPQD